MQLVTFERRSESETPAPVGVEGDDSGPKPDLGRLEFSRPGFRRLGALLPPGPRAGDVVDLNRALAVQLVDEDVGAPEAEADSLLPSDMLLFLEHGERALEAARAALAWAVRALESYDAPDLLRVGVAFPRRAVRLCAPVPKPGKLLGVARNYPAHAAETGQQALPKEPVLFVKASSAVIGPEDEIVLPRASQQVDYEGELAVVIGRRTRDIAVDAALSAVGGFCAANDVTARDFQNVRGQHFIGKSCDSFAPLGPALVTPDEISDPQNLGLRTTVSGEIRQDARTAEMQFSIADLIAFASRLMTLEPGDILLTGTPAGVGAAAKPQRWLRDGDVVDVEIERIGRLRNYVRME